MVDPNSTKFWLRKVIKNQPEDEICTITIDIPESIITSRDINYITLSPYPAGMVDIVKIEYQKEGNNYSEIPNSAVNNATNSAFIFPIIGTRQIRITLKQKHYIINNSSYVYYLGIRQLGIYNLTYKYDRADLKIPILFPDNQVRQILKVKPIFANESVLTDTTEDKKSIFNYGFYNISGGSLELISDLITSNQILMKVSLGSDPINHVAPALIGIELTIRTIT